MTLGLNLMQPAASRQSSQEDSLIRTKEQRRTGNKGYKLRTVIILASHASSFSISHQDLSSTASDAAENVTAPPPFYFPFVFLCI